MKFTTNEIRQKFLDFMETKGHYITESAPLIPENDASVLFNVAGMQPMVPYLLGEVHPKGKRIANSQKCVRTNDIEEVGDDTHLTFFEMLGNWSLGDFFKEESIAWSYEFLTSSEWLALDPKYIAVTVFEGDQDAPRDEEAADIWKKVGMPEQRISYLDKAENWWAAGDTGPCGPDSEIFYWVGEGEPTAQSNVAHDEDNWMEIWNNVFMEYIRDAEGNLSALPNKNIDTGMGLERITATLNGVKSVYETDAFSDVLLKIKELVGEENYNEK
jgi:alanyl-tRNA synthetase